MTAMKDALTTDRHASDTHGNNNPESRIKPALLLQEVSKVGDAAHSDLGHFGCREPFALPGFLSEQISSLWRPDVENLASSQTQPGGIVHGA